MAKAYIQLYYDFIEATEALSDEECGRLVRAMVEYGRSGVIPKAALFGNERCVFPTFRLQIDRDNRAYEARVLQNAINGRKGGRPRKDENDEINPTVFSKSEISQDKDKEKGKEEYEEKEEARGVSGAAAPRAPSLDDVVDFCRENGLRTDPHTFWNHYQSVGWRAGNRTIRNWQAKLREWDARDATAAPPKTPRPAPANPALNYAQRDYPDDDHYYVDLDAYGDDTY